MKRTDSLQNGAYRNIFHHSAVAFWEEDISQLRLMVKAFTSGGPSSLKAHMDEHPEFVREAVRSIIVTDVNAAALQLYEAGNREQLLGPLDRTLDEDAIEEFKATILAVVTGEREIQRESTARTLGGRRLSLIVNSYIPAEDDPYASMIVSVIDISDRKRIENELREAERRLATIVEFLPDATFAIDQGGIVIAWNHAIEDMTGVAAKDMVGKGDYEYSLPFYGRRRPILIDLVREPREDIDRMYDTILRREKDNLIADVTIPRLREKENVVLWGKATVLYDSKGSETGAIESIRDITERKLAEDKLRLSEAKYRTLVENASEAIVVVQDEVLKFSNARGKALMGFGEETGSFHAFIQHIHAEDRATVMASYGGHMHHGSSAPWSDNFRICTSSGEVRQMSMTSVILDWEGRPASLCFLSDTTERDRTQEALQTLQKLESLGTLAGGIAHDFNNQLTGILGNIGLVMDQMKERSEGRSLLREAHEACLVARSLANQLLTLSTGGSPVVQVVDLRVLLEEETSFAVRGTSAKYRLNVPSYPLPAKVDPQQLRQVVQNLVINAVQAMPKGGLITLNASIEERVEGQFPRVSSERVIRISIHDEGMGIAAEHLGKVFDPFFSTKARGRGLGLTMCYSILTRHGGSISVDSTLGTGTTFTILLPASTESNLPLSTPASAVEKGTGRDRKSTRLNSSHH
jgi:two-component system, cell cycle sensor histidine kinase and response regulator CckA